MKKAEYKNHLWCWDFTMDETAESRRLKWFSVLDEFTRECLALEVERRMTARDVVTILTWLEAKHGAPGAIRSDNGPEFIARAVGKWLAARKVGPLYIAPGTPWENGYSESFNSRMKAEFANREVFGSLLEAKVLGAEYQRYWNQERLHSGIGYQTQAEFAAELGPDSATLRPPQVRSTPLSTLTSTGQRGLSISFHKCEVSWTSRNTIGTNQLLVFACLREMTLDSICSVSRIGAP
jgi:putative transposase